VLWTFGVCKVENVVLWTFGVYKVQNGFTINIHKGQSSWVNSTWQIFFFKRILRQCETELDIRWAPHLPILRYPLSIGQSYRICELRPKGTNGCHFSFEHFVVFWWQHRTVRWVIFYYDQWTTHIHVPSISYRVLARIIFKRTKKHVATTMTRRLVKNRHFPSIKGKQKCIAMHFCMFWREIHA
jgi:hypothetical protein